MKNPFDPKNYFSKPLDATDLTDETGDEALELPNSARKPKVIGSFDPQNPDSSFQNFAEPSDYQTPYTFGGDGENQLSDMGSEGDTSGPEAYQSPEDEFFDKDNQVAREAERRERNKPSVENEKQGNKRVKNAFDPNKKGEGGAADAAENAKKALETASKLKKVGEKTEVAAEVAANWEIILAIIIIIVVIVIIVAVLVALNMGKKDDCNPTASQSSSNNVIVLDPGHITDDKVKDDGTAISWGNTGGSGNGLEEYKVVWNIANELKPKLEAKGYKVVLTKTSLEQKISNKERAEVANTNNALLFFRIHNEDTNTNKSSGFFLMYPDREGRVNDSTSGTKGPSADVQQKSKNAAETIFNKIKDPLSKSGLAPGKSGGLLSEYENGGNADNGGVLIGSLFSKVPVSLIEIGNLDSSQDATWLKKQKQHKYTDGLFSRRYCCSRTRIGFHNY